MSQSSIRKLLGTSKQPNGKNNTTPKKDTRAPRYIKIVLENKYQRARREYQEMVAAEKIRKAKLEAKENKLPETE